MSHLFPELLSYPLRINRIRRAITAIHLLAHLRHPGSWRMRSFLRWLRTFTHYAARFRSKAAQIIALDEGTMVAT